MSNDYFSGRVSDVVFENPSQNFYILRIVLDADQAIAERLPGVMGIEKTTTIRGTVPGLMVQTGTWLGFEGKWVDHPKYGRQIEITKAPVLKNGWDYLTARNFLEAAGIDWDDCDQIRDTHGEDGFVAALDDPKLLEQAGFDTGRAVSISDRWVMIKAYFHAMEILRDLNLPKSRLKAIWSTFGDDTERVLCDTPWRLVQIDGISFQQADELALRMGKKIDDPGRGQGAVLFVCKAQKNMGHLYQTSTEVIRKAQKLLPRFAKGDLRGALNELAVQKLLVIEDRPDGVQAVFEPWYHFLEVECAAQLHTRVAEAEVTPKYIKKLRLVGPKTEDAVQADLKPYQIAETAVKEWGQLSHLHLSDEQFEGVVNALLESVSILTGLPGTGKTTSLRAVVKILQDAEVPFLQIAPTGIASKKMSQATGAPAYTIHRAFEAKGSDADDGREKTYFGIVGSSDGVQGGEEGEVWDHYKKNPHPADVVIIDEACLPYKQFVDLADGTKRYVGTIVNNRESVEVMSYNADTGCIEACQVVNWFKYPRRQNLYRIYVSQMRTRHRSRILRCTGNHKIYLEKGEQKRAKDIQVGDLVQVRGKFFNSLQQSFLLGSLLGDASLGGPSGKIASFIQGEDQKEYLEFKSSLFQTRQIQEGKSGYCEKAVFYTCTTRVDGLESLYDLTYPLGRKTVTRGWLDQIDEIGLAAWYMDDGSLSKGACFFHTEGFTRVDNDLLCAWLKEKWGFRATVYENGKGHFYLRMYKADSVLFCEKISPWVHPIFRYKIVGDWDVGRGYPQEFPPYGKTDVFPVQKIEEFSPTENTKNFVYDIEVEGNHNYYSNGILVSNSMVDQHLLYRILECTKDTCRLVFVGDAAQLPSVGPGNVLRDLVASGLFAVATLVEIFRQDEASDIVLAAHAMHTGRVPGYKGSKEFILMEFFDEAHILEVISKLAKRLFDRHEQFQVISPRHAGLLGVTNLNAVLRELLNPAQASLQEMTLGKQTIREDDRVMVVKNNYKLGVFNGDVGKIARIDRAVRRLEVRIQGETPLYVSFKFSEVPVYLRMAYACTVHKFQGLEIDNIIAPVVGTFGHQLQRNLYYTAITRAKKRVCLVGTEAALTRAVQNSKEDARNTLFLGRLESLS